MEWVNNLPEVPKAAKWQGKDVLQECGSGVHTGLCCWPTVRTVASHLS